MRLVGLKIAPIDEMARLKNFLIPRGTGRSLPLSFAKGDRHKSWLPSSLRPKISQTAVCTVALAIAATLCTSAAFADEDWQIVTTPPRSEMPATPHHGDSRQATTKSTDTSPDGVIDACGEEARPADEQMASILERVSELWNVKDVQVYESVKPSGPHARAGGCVFYNRKALGGLLG